MRIPLRLASIASVLFGASVLFAAEAKAQVGPPDATKLVFYNASNADVAVGVAGPSLSTAQEDGCQNASLVNLRTINLTTNGSPTPLTVFSDPKKAWFMLPRGHRIQVLNVGTNPYTGRPSACIQGMSFGFGAFPSTCPIGTPNGGAATFPVTTPGPNFNKSQTINLPNGSNGFECTINLPGTVNGQGFIIQAGGNRVPAPTQEFINLTCLSGANCTLDVQLTPPASGPFWIASGTTTNYRTPVSFQNSWVDFANKCDNNCIDPRTGVARLGVFPYGCSQCNRYPDPGPACGPSGNATVQFCAAKNGLAPNNGCGFIRNAQVLGVQKFGGTIQVNFLGPLSPPGTCPPGSKQ